MKVHKTDLNTSFSSHLFSKQVARISNINPKEAEKYFEALGIDANFADNSLLAALNVFTAKIFLALGLPLPKHIRFRNFPKKDRNTAACAVFTKDKERHKIHKHLTILFDKKFIGKRPYSYNNRVAALRSHMGNAHFLNIPIHEYMHAAIYRKIYPRYQYWHTNWDKVIEDKFTNIDLSPFRKEIGRKIGTYGQNDSLELHAMYWTKEICKSLDSNLRPKYNPFETPKIQLSPLLREFITKFSEADYKGAKEVVRRAKKLQQNG